MKILESLKKPFASVAAVLLVLQFLFIGVTPVMATAPTPIIQTLQTPASGSFVNYSDLVFFWDVATDLHLPVEYKFEISTSSVVNAAPGSQFSGGVVYEKDWNTGLLATTIDASDNAIPLLNGTTYYWHVRAEDSTGGTSNRNTWSEVRSFTIDNTGPTVTIDSPVTGSLLNRTVHIDATASDSTSSVSKVDFYENATLIGTDSNGMDGYDIDWDTTGLNGNYGLTAVAFDSAINSTTSAVVTVEIDNNAPPSPVAGPPADGTIINPNTSGVALNWSDVTDPENHGLQYRIEALWDGSSNWVTWASGFNSPFSLVGVGDTTFKWRIVACDNVGTEFNCSAPSEERLLTLDSSAPAGIGEPIAKKNNGTFLSSPTTIENVNWEWTAPDSSIAGLEYYDWQLFLDGSLYDSGVTTNLKVTKTLSIEGVYSFQVRAKDNADNFTEFSVSSDLEYDNTPPAIPVLDSPTDDYYSNISNGGSYPTLSWFAVEDLDLAKYSFQICKDDPSAGPCNQERITTLTTTSRTLINPLADGEYWWRVRSEDDATNKSAWSGARRIVVDTVAPVVAVTTPEDGLITNNSTQTFTATAGEDVVSCRLGNPVSANVGLMVNWYHSYPEDTNGTWALISPNGTRIGLPDRYANAGPGGNSWVSPVSYSLAGFDTEDPNGTWTLTVGDYVWRDSGAVTSFNIVINGTSYSWSGWAGVYTGSTTNVPLVVNVGLSGEMTQDDEGVWSYTMSDMSDGLHTYQVSCTDAAGNTGTSETRSLTVDTANPTADIDFNLGTGPTATGLQVQFNEAVNPTEAENTANYFLSNWPGAGGSGPLTGNATVSYDTETNVATVTFTNPGWYVSPEQLWGVENIHDLAGNLVDPSPTSEYSTPMIDPTTGVSVSDSGVVTLIAVDNEGGSGIKSTYYRLDDGVWTLYEVPVVTEDGTHIVCYYSTDNAGNVEETNCTETFITDNNGPVIANHEDVTVEATSKDGAVVTYMSPTATDVVDDTATVDCLPVSGSVFKIGKTTVDCSSTDSGQNTSTSSFIVNVVDTTGPIISVTGITGNITVGGIYTELGATASDLVDGTFAASATGSVNTAVAGTYTITYNATDVAGNVAIPVTRVVTVVAAPPIAGLFAPAGITDETPGEVQGVTTQQPTTNTTQGASNQDVQGSTDDSEDEVSQLQKFMDYRVLGIKTWLWILLLVVASGIWWSFASRRRRK